MALNINGGMKVKTLKADFKKEFGLTLRVYDGRSFADDDATLASIRKGDSKGGEFSPKRNIKVGNLEDKIEEMFGIKTQVAGSDDGYLCDNDHTLAKALEADEKLMIKREELAQIEKKAQKVVNSDPDYYSGAAFEDLLDLIEDVTGKSPEVKYKMDFEIIEGASEDNYPYIVGYVISENTVAAGNKKVIFEGSYSTSFDKDGEPQKPKNQGLSGTVTGEGLSIDFEEDWIEEDDMEKIKDFFK